MIKYPIREVLHNVKLTNTLIFLPKDKFDSKPDDNYHFHVKK